MKGLSGNLVYRSFLHNGLKDYLNSGLCLLLLIAFWAAIFSVSGCQTTSGYRVEADRAAQSIIREKERQVFGELREFSLERPADILRRRLLIEQDLPKSGQASLGTDQLDKVPHWPEQGFPETGPPFEKVVTLEPGQPLRLSLIKALQVGAFNSPEYQTKKEEVFKAALDLDLRRHNFDAVLAGSVESAYIVDKTGAQGSSAGSDSVSGSDKDIEGFENSGSLSLSKTLYNGMKLSAALTVDLVKLLTQGKVSSLGISGDASISIPLLRGSGRYIVTEPLTQAERNVVYALQDFERFKKTLAVDIAANYLNVLDQFSQVDNALENYKNLMVSAGRTRALANAGRTTEIEVGQVGQDELKARDRWITAMKSSKESLDDFKILLGLPPDAQIILDNTELDRLKTRFSKALPDVTSGEESTKREATGSSKVAKDILIPDSKNAGPFEIDETEAINIGLENRLDLRNSEGKVFDAQRAVVVQADALRAELTLLGKAGLGGSRSIYTADQENAELRADRGIYTALFNLDLPLDRTAERNAYRDSYIALERAVRDFQKIEDEIKRDIRNSLREMSRNREKLGIQNNALTLAEKRVRSTGMFFDAGRAELRDLLDAQEALLTARNAFIQALVDYRVAELAFQRDTGLLNIDGKGLMREYTPPGNDHGKEK